MKVYIVWKITHSGSRSIDKIFKDKEKALEHVDERQAQSINFDYTILEDYVEY